MPSGIGTRVTTLVTRLCRCVVSPGKYCIAIRRLAYLPPPRSVREPLPPSPVTDAAFPPGSDIALLQKAEQGSKKHGSTAHTATVRAIEGARAPRRSQVLEHAPPSDVMPPGPSCAEAAVCWPTFNNHRPIIDDAGEHANSTIGTRLVGVGRERRSPVPSGTGLVPKNSAL